ncbi:unnamed protein product, partial [marine sediment metagenome]
WKEILLSCPKKDPGAPAQKIRNKDVDSYVESVAEGH